MKREKDMNKETLIQPDELAPAVELVNRLLRQLDAILLGRTELHRLVLVGILARGHILLEGLPGLGKTALVKALGELMSLQFKRVQFTPDLMPSDILGTQILQQASDGQRQLSFQAGPVFTNILLADEINRASPKTQSALLEAMQEHHVTILGETIPLPRPFFVLASQNPIELEGTYPLPEAQLDRFLFKLVVRDLDAEVLSDIITTRRRGEPPKADLTIAQKELESLFAVMERIYLPTPVARYIARLGAATHPDGREANDQVRQYVRYGASPRAAIWLAEAARGHALINGRPTAGFEDVQAVAPAVLNHRIILNFKARFDGIDTFVIIRELLETLDEAGLKLPSDMRLAQPRETT